MGWLLCITISGSTKKNCDRAFNILKVLCWNQNIFNFDKCCEILNTINTVEFIQMFHENFFDSVSLLDDLYDLPDTKTVKINHVL